MKRMLICALLALAACSSSSDSKSSGSTTGTSGGSTTGGTSATSSGTGSTGGSSGSTGSTTGSVPDCYFGQRWDGSACAPSKWATVGINEEQILFIDGGLNPVSGAYPALMFGEYLDGGQLQTYAPSPIGCTVTVTYAADAGAQPYTPISQYFAGDWGTVTLAGTAQGTLTFDVDAGLGDVKPQFDSSQPVLAAGNTLVLNATGGADFPAANFSVVTPAALTMSHATLVRGQPYPITWSGTGANNIFIYVEAFGPGESFIASCVEPDTGSFTLDASATAQLPSNASVAIVEAIRNSFVEVQPTQPFVVEELYVSWLFQASVDLQ